MFQVIAKESDPRAGVPIKVWTDTVEEGALEQAFNLSNLPFASKHIALMPDVHLGVGMPIGGVLAADGAIIPNAVGVDIGCGMSAITLPLEELDGDVLRTIMGHIRTRVPVGMGGSHKTPVDDSIMPKLPEGDGYRVIKAQWENARRQMGTLGSGNHFIEIQRGVAIGGDGSPLITIMVHSGSRNLGLKVANYYNDIAVRENKGYYSRVPADWKLAFLPLYTIYFREYLDEMKFCVEFARMNRAAILAQILWAFNDAGIHLDVEVELARLVNCTHNYAAFEHHFGRDIVVHRKGAVRARKGEIVIIPGSQGTHSYIGIGQGNLDSFESCSHGAGRKMGRRQARRELNLDDEIAKMGGVVHGIRAIADLDEAPGAYKNIADVMAAQQDLVTPLVELSPLAVIKG